PGRDAAVPRQHDFEPSGPANRGPKIRTKRVSSVVYVATSILLGPAHMLPARSRHWPRVQEQLDTAGMPASRRRTRPTGTVGPGPRPQQKDPRPCRILIRSGREVANPSITA